MSTSAEHNIPSWLATSQDYKPLPGKQRYLRTSALSLAGVLQQFRLDDGHTPPWSPSAPVKMLLALCVILLVSLSHNFAFVAFVLSFVLVRAALLPAAALKRLASVACAACAFSFLLMLPAIFLGQQHSAVLIATKVFVSVSLVLLVTLTTPYNELTASLRAFRVPSLFIMTIDLALKNIVRLGRTSLEVLESLTLCSVGKNVDAGGALGGVAGTVFLKSNDAAQETYDAMCCRGFDGTYQSAKRRWFKPVDAAWLLGAMLLVGLFVYLQGVV